MQRYFILVVLMLLSISIPVTAQENVRVPDEPARWDGQSRFNILVLGMDRRPNARDNLNARTDVVMVVSFDPINERLGILHIPRDTYVGLIGGGLKRVNTLLVEGEDIKEGYGPHFAMKTLEANLGMSLDAYVAFDFQAFIDVVDALGGITVEVQSLINDPSFPDMNYGFDPLYLEPGEQSLDGYTALQYARTRHGDNDYERGERQLQVIAAVRDKLSQPTVLQDLIVRAPQLVEQLDGHLYTNLPTQQGIYLGMSMMLLDGDDLYTGVLDPDYTRGYTWGGERVRVIDDARLRELLRDLFGENYQS